MVNDFLETTEVVCGVSQLFGEIGRTFLQGILEMLQHWMKKLLMEIILKNNSKIIAIFFYYIKQRDRCAYTLIAGRIQTNASLGAAAWASDI